MRLCVFCGSKTGKDDSYVMAAERLGRRMVKAGLDLVYGGAGTGLMRILADTVLSSGGRVIGVIPSQLSEKEIAHPGLTELKVVDSMHSRKMAMSELSDGFVALPGGLGTLDELFESLTWAMIGLHRKPCGLLNVNGYYDPLLSFLDQAARQGFVEERHHRLLLVETEPGALLARMFGC